MNWPDYITWACVAVNGACIAFNLWNARRLSRSNRKVEKLQAWYQEEAERIATLDVLLMQLCVQAAGRDCGPVWQAWAHTLGEIRVEIGGRFRGREWSSSGSLPTGAEDVPGLLWENGDDHG